jgi:hypothetical protein
MQVLRDRVQWLVMEQQPAAQVYIIDTKERGNFANQLGVSRPQNQTIAARCHQLLGGDFTTIR